MNPLAVYNAGLSFGLVQHVGVGSLRADLQGSQFAATLDGDKAVEWDDAKIKEAAKSAFGPIRISPTARSRHAPARGGGEARIVPEFWFDGVGHAWMKGV